MFFVEQTSHLDTIALIKEDINLEILHFKQFHKHFVFDKDEEGYVKKTQKNYMDVRVVLQLV